MTSKFPRLLGSARRWLNSIPVENPALAHLICRLIPASCPFEHDFVLFGRHIHTPALCELNPFYQEFVALRCRALSYLADTQDTDINAYIH
jgi:hypothetical protein